MKQLVLLYWGCVFLMYLSQTYYPVETQLDGPQTGKPPFHAAPGGYFHDRRHCVDDVLLVFEDKL